MASHVPSNVASMPRPANVTQDDSVIDMTQDSDDDGDEEDDTASVFGSVSSHLVGIRYYTGVAHFGEYVNLVREPTNQYDRNAIRVDNMRSQKVGHIKREHAVALAPIMDQYGGEIQLDGSISGGGDGFKMPLKVDFVGPTSRQHELAQLIGAKLKQRGIRMQSSSFQYNIPPSLPVSSKYSPYQHRRPDPSIYDPSISSPKPVQVEVKKKQMNWMSQQKELDDLFEKQAKEQLADLPEIDTAKLPLSDGTTLFPHQEMGLRWLAHQESGLVKVPFYKEVTEKGKKMWLCEITNSSQATPPDPVKGAILCDDMGLGKTLQTIALMLANPPAGVDYAAAAKKEMGMLSQSQAGEDDDNTGAKQLDKPNKTQIRKLKAPLLQQILNDAGVVLTSTKKESLVKLCMESIESGGLLLQQYHDGSKEKVRPKLAPTSATASASTPTTILLCPVSVMSNWIQQIENFVQPGALRVALYHGVNRSSILTQLDKVDVLISSYHTVGADYAQNFKTADDGGPPTKKVKKNSIFDILFHRVVLDEAHFCRSMKTRFFKGAKALKADRRICLTGTPLQNRPDDVLALLNFLCVDPLGDPDVFRRAITQPLRSGDEKGLARLRAMMAYMALRRNKSIANLNLPEKTVEIRAITFPETSTHKEIYDTLFESARTAFGAALFGDEAAAMKNYSSVFETLLRIRQACCSGCLVPKERLQRAKDVMNEVSSRGTIAKPLTPKEGLKLLEKLKGALESEDSQLPAECAICLNDMEEAAAVVLRTCGHVFCEPCISRVATNYAGKCPFCRVDFQTTDMIKKSAAAKALETEVAKSSAKSSEDLQEGLEPSPKLLALMEAMEDMKDDEKGIVFSQFTKFLDVIQKHFEKNGVTCTRIDGSMNARKRIEAMRSFSSDEGPRMILCSLMAAGVGINLLRANHCFMMEPAWSRAVENQAEDRCHRLSQARNVRIVRFTMADTVEESMIALQEIKSAMSKGITEKLRPEEARKVRLGQIRKLFSLEASE